jgi:hypothetical protein
MDRVIVLACGIALFLGGYLMIGCALFNIAYKRLPKEKVLEVLAKSLKDKNIAINKFTLEGALRKYERTLMINLVLFWPGHLL